MRRTFGSICCIFCELKKGVRGRRYQLCSGGSRCSGGRRPVNARPGTTFWTEVVNV